MKKNNIKVDGILWDMDGVLIDVSNSYRKAILKSVNYFLPSERKISELQVDEIKKIPGLNNDWDAAYILLKKIKDNNFNIESSINNLSNTRNNEDYEELKKKFQEIYLGTKIFTKTYKINSYIKNSPHQGLISKEKLLISRETLISIKTKFTKMGIVTGRPKFEAKYTLNHNKISDCFDLLVALEDTKKWKPDPEPILLAMNKMNIKSPIYIGDSINDCIAATKAKIKCLYIGKEKCGDFNFNDHKNLINFINTL